MRTFGGAWVALVTPFTADNQVNVPVLQDLTEYLLGKGVEGLYLCGLTGQGMNMSVPERKLVVETVIGQVNKRVPAIVQVGALAIPDAVELARHAWSTGADGVSSLIPPTYTGKDSLHRYFSAVAGAVPDAPFFPYIYGGQVDAEELMQSLLSIPNVAGTKFTSPDMYALQHISTLRNGDWTVFSGMDEQCVFAAMWGAKGNIGSTLNLMPGVYREIHKLCQAGEFATAQAFQLRANQVTRVLISFEFSGALREALYLLGFDCRQPRLPAMALPESQRKSLEAALNEVNFSELANM
jgi:N-acetylneuraminate lyase